MRLAIVILTFNEEKHIALAIESAKLCTEEIILIDSGSTDKTIEIAEKLQSRVVHRKLNNDFATQRNFALEVTDANWIFYLDADERITPDLAREINSLVNGNLPCVGEIKRRSIAFGQKMNYGVLRPDYVCRLFPRKSVEWVGQVHERPIFHLPQKRLSGYLWHYTYDDWDRYFIKLNQYTTIWSNNAYANGKRTKMLSAFGHAIVSFIQVSILKRGLLDGWLGMILCSFHFTYTLAKYTKLYHLQQEKLESNL